MLNEPLGVEMRSLLILIASIVLVPVATRASHADFQKMECEIVGFTGMMIDSGKFDYAYTNKDNDEMGKFYLTPRLETGGLSFIARSPSQVYFIGTNFTKRDSFIYDEDTFYISDGSRYVNISPKTISIPNMKGGLIILKKYEFKWVGFIQTFTEMGKYNLVSQQKAVICEGAFDTPELGKAIEKT